MLTLSQREREGPALEERGRVRDYTLADFTPGRHAVERFTPSPSHASRGPLPLPMGEGA
ncbi:hypothetical protein EV278_108161 [Caulobacter sp. BK020]|nr:hypothetical protein EV278_108161 [Caulobacter sp. BK020]